MEDMFRRFAEKVKTLSAAERRILNYYIAGHEIAELPELVFVSINTVKKHNRSIYHKLEVASRDELMLYIELFRCCDRLDELIEGSPAEIE
jgi:DNA-binding CsgD family transcriptional regulator